jgi:hypothetical protein
MGGSFLLQDVNLDAAILRAAVRGLVARDRFGLAIARRDHAIGVDAVIDEVRRTVPL